MYKVGILCIALALLQHPTNHNQIGEQGQNKTQSSQNKSVPSAMSQSSTDGEQKPAGDASQKQDQRVEVTSVPKITIHSEKDFLDWVILGCTLILTVVGVVGTVAAVKTLRHIRRQADTLDEHKAKFEELAKAANDNAVAARENAETTKRNLEMFISKERARIRIEMGTLKLAPPAAEYPFDEIGFKLFCEGRTPAYILERNATPMVTNSIEPRDKLPHIPMGPLDNVLHPSPNAINLTAHIFERLDDDKRNAIRNGNLFLHFFGKIIYRDIFDNKREMRFRYIWKVTDLKNVDGTAFSYWMKHGNAEDNVDT